MRWRPIQRWLLAIVLGAATTLLIAWACALWIGEPTNPGWKIYTPYDEEPAPTWYERFVVHRAAMRSRIYGGPAIDETNLWSMWIDRDGLLDPSMTYITDARGWPFLCMRGGFDIDSPDGGGVIVETHWAIVLDVRPQIPGRDKTATPILPLQPIWGGFAVNTLIYAAIWWVLLTTPRAVGRRIRRSRGLCLECGYDLRGADHAVCPECGGGTGL